MMNQLSQKHIDNVTKALSGKRLEKLKNSINIINESLSKGGWVLRGSVKARAGFYQGLFSSLVDFDRNYGDDKEDSPSNLYRCLKYGIAVSESSLKHLPKFLVDKYGKDFFESWLALCKEKDEAIEWLNELRPLPVITAIGLSPKVTLTLTEMNLDLDLSSIRLADIVPERIKARDNHGNLLLDKKTGEQLWTIIYKIKWTEGIVHNTSRFANLPCHCHACGKYIPSQRFVPIEAKDKRTNKIISLWIGQDCSKNIFGIKDIGVEK